MLDFSSCLRFWARCPSSVCLMSTSDALTRVQKAPCWTCFSVEISILSCLFFSWLLDTVRFTRRYSPWRLVRKTVQCCLDSIKIWQLHVTHLDYCLHLLLCTINHIFLRHSCSLSVTSREICADVLTLFSFYIPVISRQEMDSIFWGLWKDSQKLSVSDDVFLSSLPTYGCLEFPAESSAIGRVLSVFRL